MGSRRLLVFLTFSLVLASVYSFRTLKDVEDLKDNLVKFGKHFPRHGLKLLLWLICQADIDQNGILQLNFNPANKVYGLHYFGNHEKSFPDLSNINKAYYTVGNINAPDVQDQFPDFVTQDYRNSKGNLRNLDRIVIRVQKDNPRRVDEVYITQHFEDRNLGSGCDPDNTFKISEELMRKIQEFCFPDEQSNKGSHQKKDPDSDSLKLVDFLKMTGYAFDNVGKKHSKSSKEARNTHSTSFFRSNWFLMLLSNWLSMLLSNWLLMLLTLCVVIVIGRLCKRPQPTPHFVTVSEGRPGL